MRYISNEIFKTYPIHFFIIGNISLLSINLERAASAAAGAAGETADR